MKATHELNTPLKEKLYTKVETPKTFTIKDLENAFNAGARAIIKVNERSLFKAFKEFIEDVVNEDNL